MAMLNPDEVEKVYRRYLDEFPHFRNRIVLDRPFPFEQYKVHEDWEPRTVRLLLLAEAPPWNDQKNYFYNREYEGNLSREVFELLGIEGTSKCCQLHEFKDRGYFIVDTILCVVDKSDEQPVPGSLVRRSGEYILSVEVGRICPKCILVLGTTGLRGLKRFEPYKSALAKITRIAEPREDGMYDPIRPVRLEKTSVVICPFPADYNAGKWNVVKSAFSEAVAIAEEETAK